ncbi:MAG: zinc metallopeptidase [Verrucomicrobia bacterium]|nr:zinc metallopeptidase [Verrucomicrobiota bacterium]
MYFSYWMLLILVPLLFGFYAQYRVMSAYRKNVQIPSRGGVTGRDAAQAVMQSAGIYDIEIVEVEGMLSDHYDPSHKRLALSPDNYHGSSLAAVGVAAHEAGHAIQDRVGYSMMNFRQALVPAAQFASPVAGLFAMVGLWMVGGALGGLMLKLAIAAFLIIALFQLVTLPVEFDATARAKKQLVALGIVDRDEMEGVNETLDAAALTYVAAFVASLGQLLHLVLVLTGGVGRRDD